METKEPISGTLGIYVQYLSPKVKSVIYKYLIFAKSRADTVRKSISIVTNDPTIQSFALKQGMESKLLWKECEHLLIFSVNANAMDNEYLSRILDTIDCPYEEISVEYSPADLPNKINLSDKTIPNDLEDTEEYLMGSPYPIKKFVRPLERPYPLYKEDHIRHDEPFKDVPMGGEYN